MHNLLLTLILALGVVALVLHLLAPPREETDEEFMDRQW